MARTFLLWNDSNFASDAVLSRQSSLPKSRMDSTYDSYSSFFVAFVIRFEQSTFFLRLPNILLACTQMRLSMSASSAQSELILEPRYGKIAQKSIKPSPSTGNLSVLPSSEEEDTYSAL